jgi:hypothetical protein
MHLSRFAEMLRVNGVEQKLPGHHPSEDAATALRVSSPCRGSRSGVHSNDQYIVPVEVLERREARAWRLLELQEWNVIPGTQQRWYFVGRAVPLR